MTEAPRQRGDREVGPALDLPDDPELLATRLRGADVGPAPGWIPARSRARIGRIRRVPVVIRHDTLQAAMVRACVDEPDVSEVYAAFAQHGVLCPRRPAVPSRGERDRGAQRWLRQEQRADGRGFDSLEALAAHVRHWNRSIAQVRITGTTRHP